MTDIAHRGGEPASVVLNPNRPWKMLLPPVYRYLPGQYVDAFFETGELRLSSFRQFAEHADEARTDKQEGKSFVVAQGGGRHFASMVATGQNAFVLCGSTTLSAAIRDAFVGSEAVIEITSVPDFALEVSRQLAGFVSGLSGHCIYGGRILMRHVAEDPFPLPTNTEEKVSFERLAAATTQAAQDEDMLLKDVRYAYQSEYRLLWNIDKSIPAHITVYAPQARQFCRRVEPWEIG